MIAKFFQIAKDVKALAANVGISQCKSLDYNQIRGLILVGDKEKARRVILDYFNRSVNQLKNSDTTYDKHEFASIKKETIRALEQIGCEIPDIIQQSSRPEDYYYKLFC